MKRSFSLRTGSALPLLAAGTSLVAATYGLIRLAYGLFLPDVREDLGMDVGTAGVISGGASVVYAAGALVGFLLAAGHARALVVAAGASAAVGAVGMAVAQGPGSFAVYAIASSAGAGLASPALVAVLQRHPSTRGNPRAQTTVNAGTGPGLVAAGLLALVLLPDWRLAWVIAAVVTVTAAAGVLVAGRNRSGAGPEAGSVPPASWFTAHWGVLTAALLMGWASAAVWNFGRTFLVEAGATATISVTAWIALGAGGSAVILTARWMQQRDPRAAWAITSGTVAVATAALAAAPASALPALIACAAFGWGYTAATGALIAWTAQVDAARAPAGTALLFITLILGQAVGAGVTGALIPAVGYRLAFLGAALLAAAAAIPALTRRAVRAPT